METEDMKIIENMLRKNYENFEVLNKLKQFKFEQNIELTMEAYGTEDRDGVTANLKDGRSASWWGELTACNIYNLKHSPEKNCLYDASIPILCSPMGVNVLVGIKTLTKNGLDLMQSGFKGRGLKISQEMKYLALFSSIYLADIHIIVDIIDSPIIYFNPIKSLKIALLHLELGKNFPLTFNRQTFYKTFYNKSFENLVIDGEFENFIFKGNKNEKEEKTT